MYICLLLILDELCEAGQNLATLAMEKQILADRYSVQCTGTVQYIVQNNQTLINNCTCNILQFFLLKHLMLELTGNFV